MSAFILRPLALLTALVALPLAGARAQWTADSVQNTLVRDSANHAELTPLVAPGPAGSTYVSWFEAVPGTNYQLRMQRLDSAGRPMWALRGLIVSVAPQNSALYRYDLASDRNGDALVAFQDERTGSLLPVICKVAADGSLPWGAGIVLRDSLATGGLAPTIGVTAANNVVVAWNATATGRGWVTARKFSPLGAPLWNTPYRIRDLAGIKGYSRPSWLAAGLDDALLFYVEQTGNFPFVSRASVQRLTPARTVAWTAPLNTSNSLPFFFFPKPVTDGQDGAYFVYNAGNPANPTLTTVFAQHLLAAGTAAWGPNGTELLTGTTTNRYAASDNGAALLPGGELAVVFTVTDLGQNQSGICLQRFGVAGTQLNGPAGLTLVPVSANLHRAQGLRAATGGESIAVFSSGGNLTQTISALGLTAAGAPAWTASASRVLAAASSGKDEIGLTPIRGDQLVVVWADDRLGNASEPGIYAQSIDTRGRLGGGVVTATPALVAEAGAATVWPNPGSAARLHLPFPEAATVTLRDATGRVVRTQEVLPADADFLLSTDGLPAGLYLVALRSAHQHHQFRWVKE